MHTLALSGEIGQLRSTTRKVKQHVQMVHGSAKRVGIGNKLRDELILSFSFELGLRLHVLVMLFLLFFYDRNWLWGNWC